MRERIGIISGWTFIIIVFCVFISYAVPPTPPTVNITGNAGTATSLAANPTDCAANGIGPSIDASGNLTCSQSAGTLATQNADNAIVTNLTVGGVANVTTLAANVIKTDTSADATLSGTPIIITVYDIASNTPYYFKAYPTK